MPQRQDWLDSHWTVFGVSVGALALAWMLGTEPAAMPGQYALGGSMVVAGAVGLFPYMWSFPDVTRDGVAVGTDPVPPIRSAPLVGALFL